MDNPRMELKIQEEEGDFSKSEESKMSMILNKGWRLGKKIVITGMAISSAPIVLPPLVIFSSIGFAVAVPFGFVFVSYAFTEKLMSKLLSRPLNPPSLLEYKIYDDADYVEEEGFEEDPSRGVFMYDDQEEEKKFMEDTKETLEMRIELIEDEKEEEEKPGEDMNVVMEEERGDGRYFDDYMDEEEKPGEDMNVVMEKERGDGTYFDDYVKEEETPVEDVNGVMEESADGTYFDNEVEVEEKPVEEYVGDIEEENLRRGTGGVMEDYREDKEEYDEISQEEEKPVEVISGEIEEEELVTREREEARDEENEDIVIEIEGGGMKENVGNIEENVGMPVVEEEKSVLGVEGEKGEESKETAVPTFSSSLPGKKGRRKKGKKGKKHVKDTVENVEEEKRLVREAKGGLEDSKDGEPLDKLIAMDNVEEPKAEEIGGRQNISGMSRENYIVGKKLPSPPVEIVGVIKEENVNDVTQNDDIVEKVVPIAVVDVAQEGNIAEEAVPVLDTVQEETVSVVEDMQEDNVEEAPVVDVTQVGYNGEAVPVAEIGGVVEKENVNDVAEEDYTVQQVVPVVEINGVTPETEMNGVHKEDNRDDVSVGKIVNDVEQVRPVKGTKEVMGKSKEGVVLEKNTVIEEIPVEEVHGIVKVHEGVNSILEPIRMKEERRSNEIFDRVPEVEVKPMEEMGAVVEGTQDEEKVDRIGLTDTNAVVAERRNKGSSDRMVEEDKKPMVETEKKSAPSQTENAREIAIESGLDVFDDKIVDADQSYSYGSVRSLGHEGDAEPRYVSLEQVSTLKEPATQNVTKEMADSAGHSLSVEMSKSKFNKEAHEQEDVIPSKEVLYSEEKIWEQIDAMRKIVGYKAALQATCIEELKALYVFIGVEPPAVFKVPSDHAEINDKLRLLMSIIGVK